QAAFKYFMKAIKANSKYANAYYYRGCTLCKLGYDQLAIENFTQAIVINPSFVNAYLWRGLVFSTLGYSREACDDYNQAIKINPQCAYAFLRQCDGSLEKVHVRLILKLLAIKAMNYSI
ncbi:MAG: tetratricopeptide repeat protein, partial [Cyanobacteria bacterium J06639_18]